MATKDPPADLPTEAEKDLIRQGERTVDNLKRLFAFMFAISFGVLATSAIEELRPVLTNLSVPPRSTAAWLLIFEMWSVFVVTAGVFYHQGAKFLDNRYARHPISEVHPFGFAWDYLTLVITMVPFFFMAHSLHPSVTHVVGYTWFFGFYIALLGSGLILLVLAQIRHSEFVRNRLFGEILAATEIAIEGVLRTYWLLMNSFILLLILLLFSAYVWASTPCPTSPKQGEIPYFLYLFGALALMRDYLDYRYAWRFLYPVRPDKALALDRWPLTRIREPNDQKPWILLAYIFIIVSLVIAYRLRFWDIGYWAATCKL